MEWCKFLWGNSCTAIEPFSHLGFWLSDFWFSMHFSHSARRRSWRRVRLCRFCTLIQIVSETAIVSFRTLPVSCSLPTFSKTSLFTLFLPGILDHGACFKISISGLKILPSQILLDTSLHHCLQSVIIRSRFLLMNLHIVQCQYGLEFLRLSYFLIWTSFPRWIFVIDNKIPFYFESNSWKSTFRRTTVFRSA